MFEQRNIAILEIMLDILLLMDIIFTFFTSVKVGPKSITTLPGIAKHYLSRYFIIDFFSAVPGLISLESYEQEYQKWFYYLKLFRFLQIRKALSKYDRLA